MHARVWKFSCDTDKQETSETCISEEESCAEWLAQWIEADMN